MAGLERWLLISLVPRAASDLHPVPVPPHLGEPKRLA